jgi:hypothetical protein
MEPLYNKRPAGLSTDFFAGNDKKIGKGQWAKGKRF